MPKIFSIPTERQDFVIRQFASEQDDEAYYRLIMANPEYVSKFDDPYRTFAGRPDQVCKARLQPDPPERITFGLWLGETLVGSQHITPYRYDKNVAQVGCLLDRKHASLGLATIAMKALCKFAHKKMDHSWIVANTYKNNDTSRRVLSRAGFVCTGDLGSTLMYIRKME